ncbi:MAG: hypothetical protein ACTSXW_01780 [Candidatus Baldrarchaeia archaeon]
MKKVYFNHTNSKVSKSLFAFTFATIFVLLLSLWFYYSTQKYEISITVTGEVATYTFKTTDGREIMCHIPLIKINISDPHFPIGTGDLEEQMGHLFIEVRIVFVRGLYEAKIIWNHSVNPTKHIPEEAKILEVLALYTDQKFKNNILMIIIGVISTYEKATIVVNVKCDGNYDGHLTKKIRWHE